MHLDQSGHNNEQTPLTITSHENEGEDKEEKILCEEGK